MRSRSAIDIGCTRQSGMKVTEGEEREKVDGEEEERKAERNRERDC